MNATTIKTNYIRVLFLYWGNEQKLETKNENQIFVSYTLLELGEVDDILFDISFF